MKERAHLNWSHTLGYTIPWEASWERRGAAFLALVLSACPLLGMPDMEGSSPPGMTLGASSLWKRQAD